jgi:hypothetical protein
MWDAIAANVSGSDQRAVVSAHSTVYRTTVSGTPSASMTVQVNPSATLTVFGEALIQQGGRIELVGGKLDAQFVNIEGGALAGEGEVFVGTGPLFGQVRNLTGRVEPGLPIGQLVIDGDYAQQANATLAIDLSGITAITQYDRLAVDRYAFLNGILEVDLLSFTPTVGAMFTILTAGEGVVGEFDQLVLPGGFDWDITYGANDVVLTVAGLSAGLDGDFNEDGSVDMADYVWWRKFSNSEQDYLLWQTNFGRTSNGSGGSGNTGVPEPAAASLFALAACTLGVCRRRATRRVRSGG